MRAILFLCVLGTAASASAAQHSAIINIEGCTGITWATKGYATPDSQYGFAWEPTQNLMNNGLATAVVLCDAELPPAATAFDYAEFEYVPGDAIDSPWLAVFATGRWKATGGAQLNWMQEIGWCGGGPPSGWTGFSEWPVLNVCETSGGLDWSAAPEKANAAALSIVFLVVLPGITPSWEDGSVVGSYSQAFRIIEFYEQ